jgi:uncharacterized RDD family membrane protein YckC/type II secretory pathway pseudopilin PulG
MDTDTSTDRPVAPTTSQPLDGKRPAGFWVRAAASVIDSGVIVIGSSAIGLVVTIIGLLTGSPIAATLAWVLATNLYAVAYLAAMESSASQATLGKRAFGLTVSDLAGRRVSFGRALARACAKYLNALTLGLGWLLAGVTRKKRGLHDFTAGTMVLRNAAPHPVVWVVTAAVLCVLSMPLAGVVAAIAIPGVLRARMSGNETMAIGALRAIRAAQHNYRQDCGGYAISLHALGEPRRYLHEELTIDGTVTRSGYVIAMTSAPGSTASDTPQGCRNTVSAYIVEAVPIRPGATGLRFFVLAEDGVIYQDRNADMSTRQPIE